jgi:16S rRNA (adenine1518-N6/adenine1519-N6)-dimethyltransferase
VSKLRRQLKDFNIRPQKSLGQNFVVDSQVIRRIVECARLEPQDIVVEVGAGMGALTEALAQAAAKVYALEIDRRILEFLREKYGDGDPVVEIVPGDALEFDFAALGSRWGRKLKVVANLPYEISSPMIFCLLENRKHLSSWVLMMQREVAQRIVARRGTKEYGPLGIWSRLYTRPEIVFFIPPGAFYPRPKVDSAVVRFEVLPEPSVEIEDERVFRKVIRSAFGYRRKTLANALQRGGFAFLPKEKISQALQDLGIDPEARGEVLSLEHFSSLARAISAMS